MTADQLPDPLTSYRELVTFGRTETEDVYWDPDRWPPGTPIVGHALRARWVALVCAQAWADGFKVWSDPSGSNTDAMLASVGVWVWAGQVELLRPDGTRYPPGLRWWGNRFELKERVDVDWADELRAARARVGVIIFQAEPEELADES
jgi:hypothetical protein